ncbi:MAG: acetylornithine transaminase [Candidatus Dormibacteria bacterium]
MAQSTGTGFQERAAAVLMDTGVRQPILLTSGHGVWVTDGEGRELIDMVAGIAVNVLGHCPPAIRGALHQQGSTLIHTSHLYYTEPQLEVAERLIALSFPSRVFFCNSGAEANEAAIKLARKWGRRHRYGATTIICAEGAFHGRTLGALAATGEARYRAPFEPLPPGFVRVPFNDADAIAAAISADTAAVLLEPVLGETGVFPMNDGVLRRVRELCDEHHILLILDEVQTGMGRTGRWWAHQHAGITPDIMTVAKGLGGGFPVGAVLAAPNADVFEKSNHGCTFGGSPLAAAVASAVLTTIENEGLVDNAARSGERLRRGLLELGRSGAPIIEVRGRGLMLGAALAADVAPQVAAAGLVTGVLVNPVGARTLRLLPPLTITNDEVDEALRRLGEAFDSVAGGTP